MKSGDQGASDESLLPDGGEPLAESSAEPSSGMLFLIIVLFFVPPVGLIGGIFWMMQGGAKIAQGIALIIVSVAVVIVGLIVTEKDSARRKGLRAADKEERAQDR